MQDALDKLPNFEYIEQSDEYLLQLLYHHRKELEYHQEQAGRIEQALAQRLDERESTVIPSDTYKFEWPKNYDYPPGCFTPLKEVLTEAELAECYTPAKDVVIPEHTETVPEQWSTVKLLSIAKKRGPAVMSIIERNRMPKRSRPKFERRNNSG